MNITFVAPADVFLNRIADHMNPLDVQEVAASGGYTPLAALLESRQSSYQSYVALCDGIPQVAFGCALGDDSGFVGVPWMLATPEIKQWSRRFLRMSRAVIDRFSNHHNVLLNYVDERHTEAQRWLEWLGFRVTDREPDFGVERRPFLRYEMNV